MPNLSLISLRALRASWNISPHLFVSSYWSHILHSCWGSHCCPCRWCWRCAWAPPPGPHHCPFPPPPSPSRTRPRHGGRSAREDRGTANGDYFNTLQRKPLWQPLKLHCRTFKINDTISKLFRIWNLLAGRDILYKFQLCSFDCLGKGAFQKFWRQIIS